MFTSCKALNTKKSPTPLGQEEEGNFIFLALELCELTLHEAVAGGRLHEAVAGGRLAGDSVARDVLVQAARGVAHLHAQTPPISEQE